MNHFKIVCLLTFLILFLATTQRRDRFSAPIKRYPSWLLNYQEDIKDSFKRRELSNLLFATLTGKKEGITSYTKNSLLRVNLIFLLNPGSYHLAAIFLLLRPFFKMRANWRSGLYFLLSFFNSKFQFLFLRRALYFIKSKFKIHISVEILFYVAFLFVYFNQNFYSNPIGFIYTFAIAGTFLTLRHQSKKELIIGIFTIQLIINLFLKQKLSFLSVPLGMLLGFSYIGIFILTVIFYLFFWAFSLNWIEPIIFNFVQGCKFLSKAINGSFTCSSIFLIFAMLFVLSQQKSKKDYFFFTFFLFLHTDIAAAPAIIRI